MSEPVGYATVEGRRSPRRVASFDRFDDDSSMNAIDQIRRLWEHAVWADGELVNALAGTSAPPPAVRELAHVLGASEVWLSRLEQRASRCAVWPDLGIPEIRDLRLAVERGYARYLASIGDRDLARTVAYTNSAGQSFATPIGDILLHVVLHAQYHRGKINLMLRGADLAPAPCDFIAFARGVPAAVTPVR